jgi:hypothetical protein
LVPLASGTISIFGQPVPNRIDRFAPERHVEPDVRVGETPLTDQDAVCRNVRRDGERRLATAHQFEGFGHLSFEVQSRIKNHVGGPQPADVAGRRLVQVRINPLAHELHHIHPRAPHLPHDVGHHPGGADRLHRVLARESLLRPNRRRVPFRRVFYFGAATRNQEQSGQHARQGEPQRREPKSTDSK